MTSLQEVCGDEFVVKFVVTSLQEVCGDEQEGSVNIRSPQVHHSLSEGQARSLLLPGGFESVGNHSHIIQRIFGLFVICPAYMCVTFVLSPYYEKL